LSRIGVRNFGKLVRGRKLTEIAAKHIIENPVMIANLCDLALKMYPSNSYKAELLRSMLMDMRRGSLAIAEKPMTTSKTHLPKA